MAEQQEFDPRFDPAFQRGYKPPAKPQAAPSIPLQVDSVGEPPVAPAPELLEDVAIEAAVPESVVLVGRRRINPYVVILWVVGVVFVLGGVALLFMSYFLLFTNSIAAPSQNAAAQTLYVFGTVFGVPLVTVGLVTLAGLIFFSAWRSWQRRESTNS